MYISSLEQCCPGITLSGLTMRGFHTHVHACTCTCIYNTTVGSKYCTCINMLKCKYVSLSYYSWLTNIYTNWNSCTMHYCIGSSDVQDMYIHIYTHVHVYTSGGWYSKKMHCLCKVHFFCKCKQVYNYCTLTLWHWHSCFKPLNLTFIKLIDYHTRHKPWGLF